tara:strand:- start:9816 stop:11177 length:1362 start_codon:yes stop_codon:yes gene_type:complete
MIGESGYAVIALYMMVLGVVTFVSSSFSSVILREMSISSIDRVNDKSIVVSLERILFFALVICLITAISIKEVALNGPYKEVNSAEAIYYITVLASLLFLAFNFYVSGIFGKDKQVTSNVCLITAIFIKALVGISVLHVFQGDLLNFFISQALVDFIMTIVARYTLLYRICHDVGKGKFDIDILKRNLKFSVGLTLISIIAAINLQADKALVSSMMGLELFSAYAAAASLAIIPIMLASIIGRSFYPKLVQSVVKLELNKSSSMTLFSARFYMISCLLIIICYELLEAELLGVWLGNNSIITNVTTFFPLMFLSTLLMGMQVFIYNVALAFKNTKINVVLGSINASIIILLMPIIINAFDVTYMLYAYIALNLLTSTFYTVLVFIKFKIPGIKKLITEFMLMISVIILIITVEDVSINLHSISLIYRVLCCFICVFLFLFLIYKQRFVIRSFS